MPYHLNIWHHASQCIGAAATEVKQWKSLFANGQTGQKLGINKHFGHVFENQAEGPIHPLPSPFSHEKKASKKMLKPIALFIDSSKTLKDNFRMADRFPGNAKTPCHCYSL